MNIKKINPREPLIGDYDSRGVNLDGHYEHVDVSTAGPRRNRIEILPRIPTVKLKIPGQSRIQKICYIQVIVFDLGYLPVAAVGT